MEKEGNKKQQTRARIKSIGAKRFIEAGLRETMIIDIAKEVGIDRRTIYRYYASKELLLIEICADYLNDFVNKVEEISCKHCKNGFGKVEHLLNQYFKLLREEPDVILFLGMIDTSVGQHIYELEMYKELDKHGERLDRFLSEVIEEGQKDGSINSRLEPLEYAVTINNSLVALATRIAIYRPTVLIQGEGISWKLLLNQGKILLESLEHK
jgi:TetR/AcrR family transcriptional regulator